MMSVVDNIRDQKYYRSRQRGQLAVAMSADSLPPDEVVTAGQQDKARSIQGCVEMRENRIEIRHELEVSLLTMTDRSNWTTYCFFGHSFSLPAFIWLTMRLTSGGIDRPLASFKAGVL